MKKNYFFFKHAMMTIVALFGFSMAFAQEGPKTVKFTELLNPVNGTSPFTFLYESAAAWGDFNNDGYLDVIVSGTTENESGSYKTTELYKNNGDGTFTKIDHPFPNFNGGGIVWLDYDNDGNLDLFMGGRVDGGDEDARYSGLWHNLGPEGNYEFEEVAQGVFEYFGSENKNLSSRIIAVGDYNNDGWVDIAITSRSEDKEASGRIVSLYKNTLGNFSKVNFPVNGQKPFVRHNGGTIAWGDYNNDGFLDLISFGYLANNQEEYYSGDDFSHGGACFLYKNNGDGTFAEPILFPAGEDGEVAWGDYNNDGLLDFTFGNYSWWPDAGWTAYLYENKGDGTFTKHTHEEAGLRGDQGICLAWGDVNNDGYADIVATKADPFALFLNNAGSLPFEKIGLLLGEEEATKNVRGGTVCLVDFDNDGDLDIFANGYDDVKVRSHLLRNDLDEKEGIPVNQAPTVPTNLKASVEGDVTTFTWDPSTDDLTPQVALRYNLYVKQDDVIKMVLPADLTTGRLKVNETLAPIMGTSYQMFDLDGKYEWGVQAIDNAKNASAFAKVGGDQGISNPALVSVKAIGEKQVIRLKASDSLNGRVNVYSVNGLNVYSKSGRINGTSIELPAGVYIVKTVSTEGTCVNKVIVK